MQIELILGPPGCGKTHTLLDIVEEELGAGTPKEGIMFCSFTQAGSNAGRNRAMAKFGGIQEEYRYFRTLHSLCFRALHLSRSELMSRKDYYALGEILGMRFSGHMFNEAMVGDDKYLVLDNLMRNNRKAGFRLLEEVSLDKFKLVKETYARYKDYTGKVDFTDMLEMFVKRGEPLPGVEVAILDEAQDTTTLQWKVFTLASQEARRIVVVGDDDQAIMTWSGADIDAFLNFKPTVPVRVLGHSYRLPDAVLEYAERVTDSMRTRLPKEFEGRGARGEVRYANSLDEIEFNDYSSYFVLARNNVFLDDAEAVMRKKGLVYSRKGKNSVSTLDVKYIKAYKDYQTKGIRPSADSALGLRLKPDYEITAPWWEAFDFSEEDAEYLQDLIDSGADTKASGRITLSTFHGAKGLECDHCIVLMDMTARSYANYKDASTMDDELRNLYVAVSRAKETLTIVHQTGKYGYHVFSDDAPALLIRTKGKK